MSPRVLARASPAGTRRSRRPELRWPSALFPLVLAIVVLGSGEECTSRRIVARVATAVQADGSLDREVRLSGSTSDQNEALDPAWWRTRAGVDLPERGRWVHVEEGAGWIVARGRFRDPAQVPAPVGHLLPQGEVADRDSIRLERRDLVLLTHFVYREEYGDPFDESARSGALDRATDRAAALVDAILRRRFGAGIDLSAVEAFMRRDLRTLAAEARRRGELDLPAEAFTALGLPPLPEKVPVDALDKPIAAPEEWWLCERLAERLAARGTSAAPRDVHRAFEDYFAAQGDAQGAGVPGPELESAFDLLTVYLWGVYGDPGRSIAIRFEWRLTLPGRLLRTNGVPDGDGAAWSFSDDRLSAEDRLVTAESVVLRREPLRALGARTKYDAVEIDRLAELLTRATAEARAREFLQRAVDAGDLQALRVTPQGETEFPTDLFAELADLLDPATRPLPGP